MDKGYKTLEDLFDDINRAHQLYLNGDFRNAYDIIADILPSFDMMVSIGMRGSNLGKKEYEAVYMLAGDICGELGKYDEALSFYKKHLFFSLQLNPDFKDKNSVRVYKFCTTKQYTLENLRNNEITLVDPRIQNDIVDSPIYLYLTTIFGEKALYKNHLDAFKASFNYIRCTSFCSDTPKRKAVENTLMWAHYANSHKGICIEYELGESDFSFNRTKYCEAYRLMKISYVDPANPEDILNFTDSSTRLNMRKALATKSNDWEYEQEIRIVGCTPGYNAKTKYVPYKLKTENPIKAIYFGVKCPKQRKNVVRKIFEDRSDIEFFQMKVNPKNIHRLTFDPC